MRTDIIKLTLLVAIALLLAIATGVVYSSDTTPDPIGQSRGQLIFQMKGCGGCHTIAGISEGALGPELTHVSEVAAGRVEGLVSEEYVRQSIREPQAFVVPRFAQSGVQMPTLELTDDEVDALIGFLLQPR